METGERRRSEGSAKTTKNGRTGVRTAASEEEARRRELVKDKLRQQYDLEKRALKIVERLLEDNVTEDFLVDCAKFITPTNYKDVVEERFIAKMCAYPICSIKLGKIPTQRYQISTKTNKVYDITERKCYCSNFCYKASKEFDLQISTSPLWLRPHETPPEIKLMKKGDGGSSGEEVRLKVQRLTEEDIENAAPAEEPLSSEQGPADGLPHSESSDTEQEQDFVSSVVSQRQGPRVHWGDLPKRTDEEHKEEKERRKKREGKIKRESRTEVETDGKKQPSSLRTDTPHVEQAPEEVASVEEAIAKLNLYNLSETHAAPPSVHSTTKAQHANLFASLPCEDSNSSTEGKHLPFSTLINSNQDDTASNIQPGLNITQVGMSKRGAAGLRDLFKNHAVAAAQPDSIRLNQLESLRRTLKEWGTEETLKFLYGADHSHSAAFHGVKEVEEDKEEELDEDDLEDEDDDGGQERPSAAAPDYQALRQETQQAEIRVREFYKGSRTLPEKKEQQGNEGVDEDEDKRYPTLPLVDSQAQHLIQKRIAVEKLSSCLRNIVGSLQLTMSDVSSALNNLVKTFRFTNKNIIHKTPEWTLIAVILLHLLSGVSRVVQEALLTDASEVYLNTLMEELGLQRQDLLDLVQLFKAPAH
ncbi:putative RNA polymerase II subunit B1 CTD phosphatase rpap2 isoform X2 [Gymnodraco acuticeps]|uniref:RNA polymerase II subunit B1 CTD phosphatase RPAP2 homolog n=1 Tax=Gymnodraco acuticeps TaxID=8218 RepID=A0A6P8U3E0_GYMAC|nr:putative RNA polymerase II subunit B1 CTD phosphatase rpap2 isoform X2 [Gymnodraco acuticeps]